ncbi:MAG: hypothetical protein RQ723_13450, partial [Desulfuromonadales bacterium]|nr:hypothetical protein [Desulfuromonadales bacterium]
SYVGNDPVSFTDPFGLSPDCDGFVSCLTEFLAYEWRGFQAGSDPTRVSIDFGNEGQLGALLGRAMLASAGAGRVTFGRGAGALNLQKQLASAELLGEAQAGVGISMAGAGARSGRALDDIGRLLERYGGDAIDWAKMTTRARVADDGTSIAVHWYENVRTGMRVEYKTKIGN